ncbi:MAG: type II toxin-antitoxin system PemK/MazF family toxin [Planctomycetia bacterium]
MTPFRVGEVVSVEFPFTDMQGRKRRPGIVLAGDSSDLLLARITTHEPRDAFDVPLEDWAMVGLPKPSTVRLLKLVSLDARLVHHSIGTLSPVDRVKLAEAVERLGLHIAGALRQ